MAQDSGHSELQQSGEVARGGSPRQHLRAVSVLQTSWGWKAGEIRASLPSPDPTGLEEGTARLVQRLLHEHCLSLPCLCRRLIRPSPLFPGSFPALPHQGRWGEAGPGRHCPRSGTGLSWRRPPDPSTQGGPLATLPLQWEGTPHPNPEHPHRTLGC